jgi:ABC-type methionine transport system ATPase subunit
MPRWGGQLRVSDGGKPLRDRQLVAIARTTSFDPNVLILDKPTAKSFIGR